MKRLKELGNEVPAEAVNEMLANYVLPLNKDMPHSEEPFDEVMFVELHREESHKHLDEMKQEVAHKPNVKSNSSSPYFGGNPIRHYPSYPCSPSCGSSPVQPYATPPQCQGVSAFNTGNWNSSYSYVPPPSYQSHINVEMNSYQIHQGVVPVGTVGPYQGNQPPPVPIAITKQGSYSSYSNSYSYGAGYGAVPYPTSGTVPCNSYGASYGAVTNAYPSPTGEPCLVGSMVASIGGNIPVYNGNGGYSSHAAPQAPMAPGYHPSPYSPAYGGSPYGTLPPRPPVSGNLPANTSCPAGYAPPGSGYY